jgi:hypothetical protein
MLKHLKPRTEPPLRSPRAIPWGQRIARQQELRQHGLRYACRFIPTGDGYEAVLVIPGEPEHAPDRRGFASTPGDAILQALCCQALVFASEADEQDVCLAAMRGRVVRLQREDRCLTSLGVL